jgi:forespore regulator of the sigma-K checkpoint
MYQPKKRHFQRVILRFIILGLIVALSGVSWYRFVSKPVSNQNIANQPTTSVNVDLVLKKSYIGGTEEEEKLNKTVSSTDQLMKEYQDWDLESHQGNTFVFKRKIQDLAPICKEKGYFGLSEKGILTLFEGPPEEKKVIQTFFQINTKKIESSLPNELGYLQKGIRIKDLAEYNSILSTYEEYADWSNGPQQEGSLKDSAH